MNNIVAVRNDNNHALVNHDVFLQKTTEVALAVLAGMANSGTISPAKYYWTHQFAQEGLKVLQQQHIVQNGPPETSAHTAAVYFTLLWFLSKGILGATPLNNEYLLALLSSPTAVNQITRMPAFQGIMNAVYKKEFGLVKKLIGEIFKEYHSGREFSAETDEVPPIQNRGISSIVSNVKGELRKRKQIVLDTVGRLQQIRNTPLNAEWEQYGLVLLDCLGSLRFNFVEFTSFSPFSFLFNVYSHSEGKGIRAPVFHERILSAWSLGAETIPDLSPILFISTTPDLAETVVRVSGVGLAMLSDQPFLSTLATETALKLIPTSVRQSELNQRVLRKTEDEREILMGGLNGFTREFERTLRAQGFSNANIDTAKKVLLQNMCAIAYAMLANKSSPFMLAIYTEYFCTYMAALAANHGAARPELLLPKSGFSNLPYKFFAGIVFTLSELMGLGHGTSVLLSAGATIPMITDAVALHPAYQNCLKQFLFYCEPSLRPLNRIKNFVMMGYQGLNLSVRLLPGRYTTIIRGAEGLASLGVVAAVTQVARSIYQEPFVRETLQTFKRGAAWIFNTSLKAHTANIASRFLGTTLGSLTALMNQPVNNRMAVLGALGLLVVYFTGSPTLATAAIETGAAFITNEQVQQALDYLDEIIE